MIYFDIKKIRISFSFGFFFVISFVSFGNDILILYSLLFCLLHELAHLFVMKKYGIKVSSIHFYGAGIKISSSGADLQPKSKQILIYSAGCTLNFAFALVYLLIGSEELFAINISLAVLNILPISYLDGGKILGVLFPERASTLKLISYAFSSLCITAVIALAFVSDLSLISSSLITALIIFTSLILG